MSNPTGTGEQDLTIEEIAELRHKPTTGEWITRPVKDREAHAELCCGDKILAYLLHGDAETIATAHNATLAAEQEKYVEQREDWIKEIQQLQEQLAAERGDGRDISSDERKDAALAEQAQIIAGLHQQLAAAEKQTMMDTECIERIRNHGMKMEVERDAAVEALKLCRINESARRDWDLQDAIEDALAKIGVKP